MANISFLPAKYFQVPFAYLSHVAESLCEACTGKGKLLLCPNKGCLAFQPVTLNFILLSMKEKPCCHSTSSYQRRELSPSHTSQTLHLPSVFMRPLPFPLPWRQEPHWVPVHILPFFYLLSRALDMITMGFYWQNYRAAQSLHNSFVKHYL